MEPNKKYADRTYEEDKRRKNVEEYKRKIFSKKCGGKR